MAMAQLAVSSSLTYRWTYDVFLSFRGKDTRTGFVSHLYESLRQSGIYTFIDDESLTRGEEITPSLFKAIRESRIAIIVFSENYASSTFCLEELAKILECFKGEGRLVYPIFYYVDPSDVRYQRGNYGEAMARFEKIFEDNKEKVQKWRLALSQAANLSGWHLKPGIAKEQEYIGWIACEVSTRINRTPLHVTDYPVGLVPRVEEVTSLLNLWSNEEVIMVGICGTGGIGKSTIARAVYNKIADYFESLCFLSNVREISIKHGLSHLQEILLCELVREKDLKLGDVHKGISIIEHRLHQKKILLVLDDIDKLEQLRALAGRRGWFGSGSRIIITTRNKHLLVSHGIERIYDVNELNDEEASQLFSWNAFRKGKVDSGYMDVLYRAILYSCGLPLALEVIGSNLYGKRVDEWSSALDEYERIPITEVFQVLKLSYDTLGEKEKEIFLDLACFFNGKKLEDVINLLVSFRGVQPEYAIGVLIDKCLIKIKEDCVTMHDLIEDMGKEIVRQQSPKEPGKRDRLWSYEDILHVLQKNTGTDQIEVMILDLPNHKEILWSGKAFVKMKKLKMLVIKNASFSRGPKYLPNSLNVLEWKGYPFEFLPSNFHPTKLVHLDLTNSSCKLLQPFTKKLESLSRMNFRSCELLQQIPDLSGVSNLTELLLDDCTNLFKIHDSVGHLNKLRELSAMRCNNLRILPLGLRLTSLEHLNLFGCSSLQSFPEILDKMKKIQSLDLDRTAVAELPSSIRNLIGLEILNMEECPNLKQLPASIFMLPNLWALTANFCEGMRHFKMCEVGEKAGLDYSAMSLKLKHFCFTNCNISDDSLSLCLSYFSNVIRIDLSFNNFTTLPACIKECHYLRYLLLDNCKQLQHIDGMPPNLEKFSALCCTLLTKSARSTILNQVFYQQPGKRNFVFPAKKFPEWLDKYSRGSSMSFWVRKELPTIFLWILVKEDQDSLCHCTFSVRINDSTQDISSGWFSLSTIKRDHIYVCDLQSIIRKTELPKLDKWNHVKVSIENGTWEMKSGREIYFAVHLYKQESNLENIQFMDPKTFPVYHMLPKKLPRPQYREEHEDYVTWKAIRINNILSRKMALWAAHKRYSSVTSRLYHVLLSFKAEETSSGFIRNLFHSLHQRGINAAAVNKYPGEGNDFELSFLGAKIAVIIFSKDYASSTFCLDEFVKILRYFRRKGRFVYAVFYYVDPLDVRNLRGSYGEALASHRIVFEDKKVKIWRLALSEVTNLSGWHLKPGISNELEYTEFISDEICTMINQGFCEPPENRGFWEDSDWATNITSYEDYLRRMDTNTRDDTDVDITMPQNADNSGFLSDEIMDAYTYTGDEIRTDTMTMLDLASSAEGQPKYQNAVEMETFYDSLDVDPSVPSHLAKDKGTKRKRDIFEEDAEAERDELRELPCFRQRK